MLKGQAKTDYMRGYMRRRRAAQTAAKPQREPKPIRTTPPQRMIDQIEHWGYLLRSGRTRWLCSYGFQIIHDLDLDTDEGMAEACRRYQEHHDQRRAEKEAQKEADAKTAPPRCSFCGEPASSDRLVCGDGPRICESCVAEAAAAIAAAMRPPTSPAQ
jgi:hypothetical protein